MTHAQQSVVDGIAGFLLGAFLGLFLGGYVANVFQMGGPFHGVFAVRFGSVSGAVAGAIASIFARKVHTVIGKVRVVGIAAMVGALACLPLPLLDIWPEHFAEAVASLGFVKIMAVGLVYGSISALALGELNRPRLKKDVIDVQPASSRNTVETDYRELPKFPG